MSRYCHVAVPVPLDGPFTYAIPGHLEDGVTPGVRVVVPFGARKLQGIVISLSDSVPEGLKAGEVKDVEQVLDGAPVLTDELMTLGRWAADYYLTPAGDVFRAMLPPNVEYETRRVVQATDAGRSFVSPVFDALRKRPVAEAAFRRRFGLNDADLRKMERDGLIERVSETRARHERASMLLALPSEARPASSAALFAAEQRERALPPVDQSAAGTRSLETGQNQPGFPPLAPRAADCTPPLPDAHASDEQAAAAAPVRERRISKREQRVIQMLISAGQPLSHTDLAERARVPTALLREMVARGQLDVVAPASPQRLAVAVRPSQHELDPRQQAAIASIREMLAARRFGAVLLYGVTGSGKTEVYMEAIADVVRGGGTALMLVPEIALTPAMAQQFDARFGGSVAILHSAFPGRQRSSEWRRVRNGEARVVIGTRSAVFAPLERPGIVIVDEEHDHSYKQEDAPRYNGRDLALVRARNAGAVAVLGSATPCLESRYNAAAGKYRLLELSERVEGRSMAHVQVVDMRQEFAERKKLRVFSRSLEEAIRQRLAAKEQVILLLNRRGYSPVVTCRSCGNSVQCVNCSISLSFHRREDRMVCHYCDYRTERPKACPQCNSEHIHFLGEGSEKIEALVADQFGDARVIRLDRDSARGKQQYESILSDFKTGKYDILVGTQMIAKGHDIHNVTLVGVVSADVALGLPDFRAAERTFQLLTQVAGRAGRGDLPGSVYIQTYFPDHYAIRCAAAQDYGAFYERELKFRRAMRYPPFSALANILIRSTKLELTVKWSGMLAKRLAEGKWPGVRVLGPAAAPLSKLKQEFRYQFLIKSERRDTLHALLGDCLAFARAEQVPPAAVVVDVDPFTLL